MKYSIQFPFSFPTKPEKKWHFSSKGGEFRRDEVLVALATENVLLILQYLEL